MGTREQLQALEKRLNGRGRAGWIVVYPLADGGYTTRGEPSIPAPVTYGTPTPTPTPTLYTRAELDTLAASGHQVIIVEHIEGAAGGY